MQVLVCGGAGYVGSHMLRALLAHGHAVTVRQGFSVFEVSAAERRVTGANVGYAWAPRRAGDPAVLVALSAKARSVFGWQPAFDDIGCIIETARHWYLQPRYSTDAC